MKNRIKYYSNSDLSMGWNLKKIEEVIEKYKIYNRINQREFNRLIYNTNYLEISIKNKKIVDVSTLVSFKEGVKDTLTFKINGLEIDVSMI